MKNKKKIVIVGGVAGGASTAARIRRLDEQAEIVMFEKGANVSYSNCSLPYYVSGIVEQSDDLILMNPTNFHERYRIDARVRQEVLEINRKQQYVIVKNVVTGETYEESYDYLVLAPGAKPIKPPMEGVDASHVFTVRDVEDITNLMEYAQAKSVKQVAVVGGGFIGVEVAENFKLANYDVSLVEFASQIMTPFDEDMVQILHKEMLDNQIDLILGYGLSSIGKDYIKTVRGQKIAAQLVVLAIGVKPETTLAKQAGLKIGKTGAIQVDANYRTNDPSIYAIGDAVEVFHSLTHKPTRLALAGPAQRQARAVADHLYGKTNRNRGVIGSSSIKLFELYGATTGLNEWTAREAGYTFDSVYVMPQDKVALMPNSHIMHFKLIFEKPTGKILGAQAIGRGNVDKRIDVIATIIMMSGTLEDVKDLELTYSPMLGTAKDVVHHAALVGLNILYGEFQQVAVSIVRHLREQHAFIIDAREKNEFSKGHIHGAINIPLSEFRDRLDEIPTDEPVYIHCRSGQRSYQMVRALQHLGFGNVYNISGSFLGISLYEYAQDVLQNRTPIVTAYHFN